MIERDINKRFKTKIENNVHYKNVQVPENVRKAWDSLGQLDESTRVSPFAPAVQGFFSYNNCDAVGLVGENNVEIDNAVDLLKTERGLDFVGFPVVNERVELEVES